MLWVQSLAAQPASELQATWPWWPAERAVMEAFHRATFPGRASPFLPYLLLPSLPTITGSARASCASRAVCGQARLPRSHSTLIYLLCPEAAPHEHTLKLTM